MGFDQRLPAHSPSCMGCGSDNPSGLQLEVYRHDDHVYADLTFDERQSGAPGLAVPTRDVRYGVRRVDVT